MDKKYSMIKMLRMDSEAENEGCKITDYCKFRKNQRSLSISLFFMFLFFAVFGALLGGVIYSQEFPTNNLYAKDNVLTLTREICRSNGMGNHIRTSFGTNDLKDLGVMAVLECEYGNKFLYKGDVQNG